MPRDFIFWLLENQEVSIKVLVVRGKKTEENSNKDFNRKLHSAMVVFQAIGCSHNSLFKVGLLLSKKT